MSELVRVNSYGKGRGLVLRYRDPVTGERKARAAGTSNRREAERQAALLEKELREGRGLGLGKIGWSEFVDRYTSEVLPGLADETSNKVWAVVNGLDRVCRPKKLADITAARLSRYVADLRERGRSEPTVKAHLAHLRPMLKWSIAMGWLRELPTFPKTHRAKAGKMMKGRAISGEELDRLLAKTPGVVGEASAESWRYFLTGLWWSGLRLGESLNLYWDRLDKLCIDLSGKRPMLQIPGDLQKSGRDELCPLAPEFCEFLLATPEAERRGRVFRPQGVSKNHSNPKRTATVANRNWASVIICRIGKAAGVVVDRKRGRDGKERVKFASAHDLRRSFGQRWAVRVMPPVLKTLMRHESIETTMAYYIGRNTQATADALWDAYHVATGHKVGHIGPNTPSEGDGREEVTPSHERG